MNTEVNVEELPKDIKVLEVIDRCITSRDDDHEKIKASLTKMLEDIFTTTKELSRFFREQYRGFFLLEKYYKGPKVIQPEEVDAMVIIKIPIKNEYLEPIRRALIIIAKQKLRDTQKWENISCYHIKALFLRYAKEMETDSELPVTGSLTGIKLFIHILDELKKMCETGRFQDFCYFDHDVVIDDLCKLRDIAKRLTRMVNEITVNSTNIAKWILTEEEMKMNQKELNAVGIF